MDETISGEPMALIKNKWKIEVSLPKKIVFWQFGFKECDAMPSYIHILIIHALRGTLTLM